MTVTVTPRRVALVLFAVIALLVVYLMGATRSGASPVAGLALTKTSTTTSTTPPVGGPGITVGGRAKVAGTPDTLRLDLSVVATGSTVSQALASANRAAGAVQKSLLGNGVKKEDLQTSGMNIQPDYEYPKSGKPFIKGYQVSESLSAKLRNLDHAGDAISKAVSAGGNSARVNGISLDLEDTGALVSSARDKAFVDAKAKAEQYAKAAGRGLGDVVSITEDVSTQRNPIALGAAAFSQEKLSSVPIQPGSQDVSVAVTVVFSMR